MLKEGVRLDRVHRNFHDRHIKITYIKITFIMIIFIMIIFTMIIFTIVIIIMIMKHDDHDDVHQGPFDPRVQRCKALRLSHNPR